MSLAKCFFNETTFVSGISKDFGDFGAIAEFSAFEILFILTFHKLNGSVYLEHSLNNKFSP